jgi:hypothetical protein
MARSLTKRYDDRIAGVVSRCDRAVIAGTPPEVCYMEATSRYPLANGRRIFDCPQFAMKPLGRVHEC